MTGARTTTACIQPPDVRFGSKAALTAPKSDFRFTPESGLNSDIAPCPFRANNGLTRRSKIDAGQSVKWSDGLPLDRPRQHDLEFSEKSGLRLDIDAAAVLLH